MAVWNVQSSSVFSEGLQFRIRFGFAARFRLVVFRLVVFRGLATGHLLAVDWAGRV
ncbi:MAG TPA: hypothetical protein VG479_09415 [Gaiellaceae bacterium]|nr:hypothetical protein [Gaiellaceae bacterium]